jgi:hypothetical protein
MVCLRNINVDTLHRGDSDDDDDDDDDDGGDDDDNNNNVSFIPGIYAVRKQLYLNLLKF